MFISVIFEGLLVGEKEVSGCGKIGDQGVLGNAVIGCCINGAIAGHTRFSFDIEVLSITAGEAGGVVAVLRNVTAFVNDRSLTVLHLLQQLLFVVLN